MRRIWIRLAGLWAFLSPRCGGHEPAACIPSCMRLPNLMAMTPRRIPAAPIPAMGAGTPVLPRWSWDGADRLLTAKIRL